MDRMSDTLYIQVTGGRDFLNRNIIDSVLNRIKRNTSKKIILIHGAARGVDSLEVKSCPADWHLHKKAAGIIRNCQMASLCSSLKECGESVLGVVFPGGNGTAHMKNQLKINNIFTLIINKDGEISIANETIS